MLLWRLMEGRAHVSRKALHRHERGPSTLYREGKPMAVEIVQVAEKVAEKVAEDVLAAVKADERYAPLIATLTEKAITALAAAGA